uniref:Uncharacterized protein n=1 Tax=Knipowitschia caucasica TaxID=637954 RepID=A0AAV2IVU2_KNICA
MTMELQELRDQLAQLQSENVRLQERLAVRETPADSGASTSTDYGTTSSRHRTNGSPAERSPTYGGSDSSPGGGKLQPPDVRSQTPGGEGTGSSAHRAAQEQAAPNLIAPCPKLDVTIFGMVVPQRGILVVKEPFRQQASDGVKGVIGMNVIKECYYQLFSQHGSHLFDLPEIRLAPPLWQRALQHCHRMESQTLQPERGVAKVRGTALLEPLDDCQSLQQGLLISLAMVNIHQARPGTPLPNEVQLAIKCTSVATQCAMSVIPERSTDHVKVLQQADPAIAPVLPFIQRQCAPGRMEREALDPAARRPDPSNRSPELSETGEWAADGLWVVSREPDVLAHPVQADDPAVRPPAPLAVSSAPGSRVGLLPAPLAISNSTYRHSSAQEGKLLSGFTRSARSRVAAGSGLGVVVPGGGLVAKSHVSPPHFSYVLVLFHALTFTFP